MRRSNAHTRKFPSGAIALVLVLMAAFYIAVSAQAHARAVMPVEIYASDLNRMVKIAGRELSPADVIGMAVVGPDGATVGRVVGVAPDDVAGNRVLVAPARPDPWLRTAVASLGESGLPGPERFDTALAPRVPAWPYLETEPLAIALAPARFGRSAIERHVLTVDGDTARAIAGAGHGNLPTD